MTNFRPVPLVEHAVFEGCVYRRLSRKEMDAAAKIDGGELGMGWM